MTNAPPQGFALPITLIVLSLLTVLSMGLSQMAQQNLAKIQYRQETLNDELHLKSINQWVLYQLLVGKSDKNIKYNNAFTLPVDNTPILYKKVKVQVQDAAGLMGLHDYKIKPFEQLLNQLTTQQKASVIAAQLKDWIDEDSLISYQGMEIADYLKTQQPMLPRNSSIRSLDELLELPAMTPEIFNGNKDHMGLRDLLFAGGVSILNISTTPDILLGPMLGITGKKLAQIKMLKKTKNWQQLEKITDQMWMFYDTTALQQTYQYRVTLTLPNGKKSRSLYRLDSHNQKPYATIQWQYPDNDRG